jgi:3-deoxy-manno-octulosonate cytidylyltransferase (CMP-KDO synthetase)
MINSNIKVIAVIPARLGSNRLPNKPLLEIEGKALIIRTCEAVNKSELINDVFVATDSPIIKELCESYAIKSLMTSVFAKSGTDRIYEAINNICSGSEYILNVQGDEPLINHIDIDNMIDKFKQSSADAATMIKEITSIEDLLNPNVVKVVINNQNEAIYFSRSPIPFVRDSKKDDYLKNHKFYKHIGIYLYKYSTLEFFVNTEQTKLELAENLEQLRLIENDKKIYCHEIFSEIQGVDTPDDIEKVRKIFKNIQKNDLHK